MKVVLIGDANVGKTSIINRLINDGFSETLTPTIQLAYSKKIIQYKNQDVELQICDTAGQERYQSICPNFYRDADAAVIVFDLTSRISLKKAQEWMDELKATMPDSLVIAIAGNKSDIPDRIIDYDEAYKMAEHNNCTYFDTSAKTGDGIDILFYEITGKVTQRKAPKIQQTPDAEPVNLDTANDEISRSSCC